MKPIKTFICVTLVVAATLPALAAPPAELFEFQQRISLELASDNDRFGYSAAIDGDRLVLGAPGVSAAGFESSGTAYIYLRTATGWEIERELEPSSPLNFGSFGDSVAISGNLVAIRSPKETAQTSPFTGAVYVYERGGDGIWRELQRLISDQPDNQNAWGSALAFGDGGERLVVGESGEDRRGASNNILDQDRGAVHVFVRGEDGMFSREAKLTPSDNPRFAYMGTSVAIDADTIIAGAPQRTVNGSEIGSAYVFVRQGGTWIQQSIIVRSAPNIDDYFGGSVAVRGNTIAVSNNHKSTQEEGVEVFERTNGLWASRQFLRPSNGVDTVTSGVNFGETEDVIVAVGQDNSVGGAGFAGSAYVFVKEGQTWFEKRRLIASDPSSNAGFGRAVAFDGDTILVTSSAVGGQRGAGYTYEIDYARADAEVAIFLRELFYHPTDNAPFRYKVRLFEDDGVLRPAPEKMENYYSETEAARVETLLARVKTALLANTESAAYRDLLLDVYYDRSVAEAILARRSLVDIDKIRLDAPSVAGGFVIDDEIAAYENVLPELADAVASYLDLLNDPLGDSASPPLGYTIFRERQSERSLEAATVLDRSGDLVPVVDTEGEPVIGGHKDLVLLLDLVGDYGCNAATLAWLYSLAGQDDDARSTVSDAQRFVYIQGTMLKELAGSEGAAEGDLAPALASWEQALADLEEVGESFGSALNPLGFEDDFLVLLNKRQGQTGEFFDTFNILRERLDDLTSNSNQIKRATDAREDALASYDTYRGGIDQLEDRLVDLTGGAISRLREIVGEDYGTGAYDAVPRGDDPGNGGFTTGSELWNQFKNIERSRVQIAINNTEISNLREKVRIEAERNLFETETNNAIADLRIEYADKRGGVEETIGEIEAIQAGADAFADALSPESWTDVFVNAANAAIQTTAELRKGELRGLKERLAGYEQAAVIDQENRILNANSKALIETWLLDMNTLVLNSQENALIAEQEIGRMVALYREKAALERIITRSGSNLKNRYFADPVHSQRFNNELFIANQKFEEAQQTVFFLARALEYKWNEPIEEIMSGTGVALATIFKVRNASELSSLVDAMELADFQKDGEGAQKETFEDVFSMREDAFGFGSDAAAIAAFREELRSMLVGDIASDDYVEVVIPFSTVRDPLASLNGRNFFRGPRFNFSGGNTTIQNKGRYLDKIESLQVTIPGTHTLGPDVIPTTLKYGGTGFIRGRMVGSYDNPNRPDRLVGELETFPTRVSNFVGGVWTASNMLSGSPTALLTNATPAAGVSVVDVFRERSVACTGWELRIVLKDGEELLSIDEIDDIRIYFRHTAITRQ